MYFTRKAIVTKYPSQYFLETIRTLVNYLDLSTFRSLCILSNLKKTLRKSFISANLKRTM